MALDRRIVALYDEYTHRPLDRRTFLERLAALAGSTAAASAALAMLEPNYARAALLAEDDPRIVTERVEATMPAGPVKGYAARPKDDGRHPGVLVVHENRGLNPHIEDVTRRFAAAGFTTLAVDFLAPLGGTPADADAARAMFPKLDAAQVLASGRAGLQWLEASPHGNGKAGAVGFCWGGGTVNDLAVGAPELDAGVVFYGRSPSADQAASIKAPLLLHYAERDTRINEGVPAYEAALKAAGNDYTLHMYEGADHAFHNDTSAERYNREAAELAFERTVEFLRRTLA